MNDKPAASSLPSSFKYRAVYEKGKPVHDRFDSFSIKHPPMELSRRAKIFSPFYALKGFSDAISMQEAESIARNTPSPAPMADSESQEFMDDNP